MAATYTTSNRIMVPAKGDQVDTYATTFWALQADALDQSLDGVLELTVSGSVTLTTANGTITGDQARNRLLVLTGTGGTVTVPAVEKVYEVVNGCSGAVTFTQGSGTTCVVPPGNGKVVCYSVGFATPTCLWVPMGNSQGVVLQTTTLTAMNAVSCTIPAGIGRVRAYLSGISQTSGGAKTVAFALTGIGTIVNPSIADVSVHGGVFDATWDGTSVRYEYALATTAGAVTSGWNGNAATPTAMTFTLSSGNFDAAGTITFRGFV